jgi:hypothetical protein
MKAAQAAFKTVEGLPRNQQAFFFCVERILSQ